MRKAAKKQARSENDQSASNSASILSPACVTTQPERWTLRRGASPAPHGLPASPAPSSVSSVVSSSSYALMISGALVASVPPRAPLAPLDLNSAATNNGGANPGITRADLFKTLRLAYTGRASASSSPAADAASIGQSSGSRVRRARPAASPAAGRAVAAAALPAASVIQLKFWPALPVPAARPLHICRRPLPSCSRIVAISADSPAAFST